jgi:hypothetical protein
VVGRHDWGFSFSFVGFGMRGTGYGFKILNFGGWFLGFDFWDEKIILGNFFLGFDQRWGVDFKREYQKIYNKPQKNLKF